MNPLLMYVLQISSGHCLVSHSLNSVYKRTEILYFDEVQIIVIVVASAFCVISKKLLQNPMSLSFSPIFSSQSFIVLGLTFRPLIRF